MMNSKRRAMSPASSSTSTHLIFIRTPTEPLSQDPYQRAATASTDFVTIRHLPILSTTFLNRDTLSSLVNEIEFGPTKQDEKVEEYDGIIITSSRSCQALSQIQTIPNSPTFSTSSKKASLLDRIPIFVVGQSTADSLLTLLPHPPKSDNVFGNDGSTGTGENLAKFIIEHFDSRSNDQTSTRRKRKFLFLTGDKNREIIPDLLGQRGWQVQKLMVYKTDALKEELLRTEIDRYSSEIFLTSDEGVMRRRRIWLCFFSPSGAKASIREFRRREWLPDSKSKDDREIKIASIGSTTSQYLIEEEGFKVDAQARIPSAEGLLEVIREVEKKEKEELESESKGR